MQVQLLIVEDGLQVVRLETAVFHEVFEAFLHGVGCPAAAKPPVDVREHEERQDGTRPQGYGAFEEGHGICGVSSDHACPGEIVVNVTEIGRAAGLKHGVVALCMRRVVQGSVVKRTGFERQA